MWVRVKGLNVIKQIAEARNDNYWTAFIWKSNDADASMGAINNQNKKQMKANKFLATVVSTYFFDAHLRNHQPY